MTKSDGLDIAVVVKQSGLPASTLRYYEEQGLIRSIGRNGLRRVYGHSVIQRLALITLGRNAGFSLDEVAQMFDVQGVNIDRAKLSSKAEELDHKIKQLESMRDGLRHAAACSAPSHLECPKFLALLKISGRQEKKFRREKASKK